MSGSLLSPWTRVISPEMVREEISRQMACHLDTSSITDVSTNNSNEPFNLRNISHCLKKKPLEALIGIRLPFVR